MLLLHCSGARLVVQDMTPSCWGVTPTSWQKSCQQRIKTFSTILNVRTELFHPFENKKRSVFSPVEVAPAQIFTEAFYVSETYGRPAELLLKFCNFYTAWTVNKCSSVQRAGSWLPSPVKFLIDCDLLRKLRLVSILRNQRCVCFKGPLFMFSSFQLLSFLSITYLNLNKHLSTLGSITLCIDRK